MSQPESQNKISDITQSKSEIEIKQKHFISNTAPKPVFRRLRGYAFDPSLSVQLDTALVNETVYKVIWEDESLKS